MMRLLLSLVLSLMILSTAFAALKENTPKQIKHVIYITLDGTRWQDILFDSYLKKFWKKYAMSARIYGFPQSDTTIEVASVPISLPSYQSQLSGAIQPCFNNDCGRIQVETFPEALVRRLGLSKKEVVTFASWGKISDAVQHIPDTIYTNIGNMPVYDPDTNVADHVMYRLNREQFKHHPDGIDRFDRYTFAQALHYFRRYKPRFLWIALTDADKEAHQGHLKRYHAILESYDDALDELFTALKADHLNNETLVIITTDHGRGNGSHWKDHGPKYPESKQTWGFVFNGELKPVNKEDQFYHFSTLSIRPSIEAALGLSSP